MANGHSRLWKRWIIKTLELFEARRLYGKSPRRRAGSRRPRLSLERLEDRVVPALVTLSSAAGSALDLQPPVAGDDVATTSPGTPAFIDLLGNDFDPDGSLDWQTLTVTTPPAHGTVLIEPLFDGDVLFYAYVLYTPDPDFQGDDVFGYTVQDNDGAVSNMATVTVTVVNLPPVANEDLVFTAEGTPVSIDVLANDFDPDGSFDSATLTVTAAPAHGTISVQSSPFGPPIFVYTPDPDTRQTLVVDDPRDVVDGDYSPGHLSLREAIFLANTPGDTDSFRYTIADNYGLLSPEATVTITVTPAPTTITFAPGLTALGPATLSLTLAGDTAEGNSALAITSVITIQGPTGPHGITLSGTGSAGDLRLFLVTKGGDLTLQNLTFRNWSTDGNGGVLNMQYQGIATISDSLLAGNFAYNQGGAIYNFGGTVSLSHSTLSGNRADQGGGIYQEVGTLVVSDSTLSGNRASQGGGLFNKYGLWSLTHSTLSANSASDSGGGFYNFGGEHDVSDFEIAPVTLTDSTVTRNSARDGGGFFNSGIMTLTNCVVSGNTADLGGGFSNGHIASFIEPTQHIGDLTLTNTTVSANSAKKGGGFHNVGLVTLIDSTLADNKANQGGGLFQHALESHTLQLNGAVTLTNSLLFRNTAREGGGAYNEFGWLTLFNSTLSRNSATGNGGAIWNSSALVLTNSTLSGNSAKNGGGLYNQFGLATLTNTIVAGNTRGSLPSDIAGAAVDILSSFHNLIGPGGSGGLTNGIQGNHVGVNPLLAPLANYGGPVKTFALLPGSPAIDAGIGTDPDARGIDPVGPKDIGAFESGGFTLTVSGGSGQTTDLNRPFLQLLIVTVTALNPIEPVVGGLVTFSVPPSGASAHLSAATAKIGINRKASVTARANGLPGTYQVTATGSGANVPAVFTLSNRGTPSSLTAATSVPASPAVPLPTFVSNTMPVATSPPVPPSSISSNNPPTAPQPATSIPSLNIPGTIYNLNAARQLLKQSPGSPWTIVDVDVQSYRVAPNGDLYLLNDRHELKRFFDGNASYIVHVGVTSFAISSEGTIYLINAVGELFLLKSPDHYDVVPEISAGDLHFCTDLPTLAEIMRTAHMTTSDSYFPPEPGDPPESAITPDPNSPFSNVRFVIERILDRIGPPQFYPNVGLVQKHYCTYKCTISYDVNIDRSEPHTRVLFLDHVHLHRYVIGAASPNVTGTKSAPPTVANSPAGPLPGSLTNMGAMLTSTGEQPPLRDTVPKSLTTAPDGTIYLLGGGDHGDAPQLGDDPGPIQLWRLRPGTTWEFVARVFSFAVGPDSTLTILTAQHELRTLPSSSGTWVTLDVGVQSFSMTPEGTLYALQADQDLRRMLPGSNLWTTLDTGVQSFTMAPDGTLYELNNRQQLKRLKGRTQWSLLDTGVQSFAMADDGTIYELNGRQQLKKLTPRGVWTILDTGVQSFTRDSDGTLHAINDLHQLKRLTARDHWTVIATGVQSFVVVPNALHDLYLLTDQHELKRLEAGYFWTTLRSDVLSMTMDTDGTVRVRDTLDRLWLYATGEIYTRTIIDPIEGGPNVPLFCFDPPYHPEIMRAARLTSNNQSFLVVLNSGSGQEPYFSDALNPVLLDPTSPFSNFVFVIEPVLDEVLPPRSFPHIGPAQMHQCRYQCTIYYDDLRTAGTQALVIFIDHDHLIRGPYGPG